MASQEPPRSPAKGAQIHLLCLFTLSLHSRRTPQSPEAPAPGGCLRSPRDSPGGACPLQPRPRRSRRVSPRGAWPLVTWFFRGRLHADLRLRSDFRGWWGWGRWSFHRGRRLWGLKRFFRVRTPDGGRWRHKVRPGPGARAAEQHMGS